MPAGRPTKYKGEETCEKARGLCLKGATDEMLAIALDIDIATLYRWKNDFSEFCEVLKDSKSIHDVEVEASLAMAAKGFTGPDDKYYPPNPTSAIFWLKNRQPARWRDKQEHEHTGKDGTPLVPVLNIGNPTKN